MAALAGPAKEGRNQHSAREWPAQSFTQWPPPIAAGGKLVPSALVSPGGWLSRFHRRPSQKAGGRDKSQLIKF